MQKAIDGVVLGLLFAGLYFAVFTEESLRQSISWTLRASGGGTHVVVRPLGCSRFHG